MKLDLAAGSRPVEGYTPVDVVKVTPETIVFDLISGHRWPFADDSVDALMCRHFVEHIPAEDRNCWHVTQRDGMPYGRWVKQDLLFWFFDEAFRIAKPGAELRLIWPSLKSSDAFRDPTHRRFLPLEFTHYLCLAGREFMHVEHYVVSCNWVSVEDTTCLDLEKRDPPWTVQESERVWDAQKAWSITLRAEK